MLAFLIFGIPVSGGPPNLAAFGPGFLRSLDSILPLGVAANTIRNTVYFHASDTAGHLWVLSAYAAGGLAALCLLIAAARRQNGGPSAIADRNTAARPAAPETTPATTNAAAPAWAAPSTADPRH